MPEPHEPDLREVVAKWLENNTENSDGYTRELTLRMADSLLSLLSLHGVVQKTQLTRRIPGTYQAWVCPLVFKDA